MNRQQLNEIILEEGTKREVTYRGVKINLFRNPIFLNWEANFTFEGKNISDLLADREEEIAKKHKLVSVIRGESRNKCVFTLKANREEDLLPIGVLVLENAKKESTYKTVEYMISNCQQAIDYLISLTECSEAEKQEQQAIRDNITSKIKNLYELMNEINVLWDDVKDTDFLEENYPFDYSLDEVALSVGEWLDSVREGKGL